MEHGPASEWKEERSAGYKTKLGLWLFAFYTLIYFAFIFISVLSPRTMRMDIGMLNMAIVYGFGLIILAIIMALIYNYLISKREKADKEFEETKGGAAK